MRCRAARRFAVLAAACLLAGAAVAAGEGANPFAPPQARPAAPAPQGQSAVAPARKALPPEVRAIRGRLTPPERALEAHLLERSMGLKVPVKVDPKTGAFEVKDLRMGTYDLVVRTPWGRLEGVDLTPRLSPYDALIPPEYRTPDLGLPAEGEFTEEDRKAVRRIIHEVKRYENQVTDMVIRGTADTVVVLVELLMDADFVGRKGDEITWRVERWYYEKKYDAWTTFRMECLYRYRVSKAVWQGWGWQFEPALGGFDINDDLKAAVTVEFTIPDRAVREKGIPGSQWPPVEEGKYREPPPPEKEDGP